MQASAKSNYETESADFHGRTSPARLSELFPLLALLALVTLVWCAHYHRWSKEEWKTPINYIGDRSWDMAFNGDAIWGMAATKAMATGEILPILPKYPRSLGAPFHANWNDFPSIEEGINAWWALLAKLFGLFYGSNLVVLSAHLLAAASFYFVCRYLCYGRLFSFVGAALFALSRYAFWRNLPNLSLTFYWHLPLALLVVWWCVDDTPLRWHSRRFRVAALVAVLHGVQSPYFSGLFMQLLGCAAIFGFLRYRDWRRAIPSVLLGCILVGTIALMNVDTVYSWMVDGANASAAPRQYFDVERYALRPVEFFVPRSHSWARLDKWANKAYFDRTNIPGEEGSAYLGVVGAIALALLTYAAAQAAAKSEIKNIPKHFWIVLWVLAFSITGGLNGIVGVFGFYLFRASNRYSIMILAALLLYLVKYLHNTAGRWNNFAKVGLAISIVAIGIYDQVPPRFAEREVAANTAVHRERRFITDLEDQLPEGAQIFQLPVYDFPEGPLIGTLTDYEHFRVYLQSHYLRFSYGATKGRFRDRWQREMVQLGAPGMVKQLESYGFSAIYIDRRGYGDDAESLLASLRAAGRDHVLAQTREWICLALNPARRTLLPPSFEKGWFDLEGNSEANTRWSSGDASIVLYNPRAQPLEVHLTFDLVSEGKRDVSVVSEGSTLFETSFPWSPIRKPVDMRLTLHPGRNELRFKTHTAAMRPKNGDERKLAFGLKDFRLLLPAQQEFERAFAALQEHAPEKRPRS